MEFPNIKEANQRSYTKEFWINLKIYYSHNGRILEFFRIHHLFLFVNFNFYEEGGRWTELEKKRGKGPNVD